MAHIIGDGFGAYDQLPVDKIPQIQEALKEQKSELPFHIQIILYLEIQYDRTIPRACPIFYAF